MDQIPNPPVDPIFYKWLAGVFAGALISTFVWMALRFIKAVDQLVIEVSDLKGSKKDHESRIEGLEEVVFPVNYNKENLSKVIGRFRRE